VINESQKNAKMKAEFRKISYLVDLGSMSIKDLNLDFKKLIIKLKNIFLILN